MKILNQINTLVIQFVMAIEAKHLFPDERLVTQKVQQVRKLQKRVLIYGAFISSATLWTVHEWHGGLRQQRTP